MANNKTTTNEMVQILEDLCNVNFGKDETRDTLSKVWQHYNRVRRPNYHIISQYIIKKYKKPKDEEVISIISENLKSLINEVKQKWEKCDCLAVKNYDCVAIDLPEYTCDGIVTYEGEIGTCSDYKALYRFLLKLYDHIQLEIVRLSEIKTENELLKRLNKDLQEQLGETQKSFEYFDQNFWKSKEDMEDIKADTRNMYLQMISILGIFAAIVIAVFGGLNVISSISNAFLEGETTIYRTILVAAMCTLFVVWIIFVLVSLVRWTSAAEGPGLFTIILCAVITVICLCGIIYPFMQMENLSPISETVH